jgi:penicillin-binding protein 2
VAVLAYGGLMVRMLSLQVVHADEWREAARDNVTKTLTERATRGIIRDTRGQTIATNRASYTVYATPSLLSPEQMDLTVSLMGLTPEDAQSFRSRIETVETRRRTHQIRAFADITRDQVAALEEHSPELPGIDVVAGPVRQYAFGALGAHTVGYLNEVSAEDLERLADQNYYRAGDRVGRMGIERSLESVLRGRRGFRHVMVNARGRRLTEQEAPPMEGESHREAVPGHDVVLTLDMELMRMAQRAFQGHPSGGVVVVDVHTGRIRALYSKPAYDLNELTGRLSVEAYREMVDNPHRPLIDKTIYDTFFPGSTFKPFSALSALQEGAMDPRELVFCEGSLKIGNQRMRCTAQHGDVDMRSALVQSCNVYFWALAERVGLDRLNRYARDFGLAERTGIGINSEARGFLASRQWYEEHYGRFRLGYTLNTAIGQGNTRVTLLQLALAYAALANGGVLYAPQLIERIETPDGAVVEEPEPHVRRRLRRGPRAPRVQRRSPPWRRQRRRGHRLQRHDRGRRVHQRQDRHGRGGARQPALRRRAPRGLLPPVARVVRGLRALGRPAGGHRGAGGARRRRRSKRGPYRHAHPAGVPGGHHRPAGASPARGAGPSPRAAPPPPRSALRWPSDAEFASSSTGRCSCA